MRGGRQEFLYSRVMCWVAIDRAIRLAQQALVPGAAGALARGARHDLPRHLRALLGCRRARPSSSTPGATTLDASSLLMPLVRFVSPTDPRWISTLRAIEQRAGERLAGLPLPPRRRLLRRPHRPGGHVLDVLVLVRRVPVARWATCTRRASSSRRCSATRTTSGSTARSSGPQAQHLGNFPQAFTHLALISAAYDLDRRLSAAGHAG